MAFVDDASIEVAKSALALMKADTDLISHFGQDITAISQADIRGLGTFNMPSLWLWIVSSTSRQDGTANVWELTTILNVMYLFNPGRVFGAARDYDFIHEQIMSHIRTLFMVNNQLFDTIGDPVTDGVIGFDALEAAAVVDSNRDRVVMSMDMSFLTIVDGETGLILSE